MRRLRIVPRSGTLAPTMLDDLIYDVGLNDGRDTAYYLRSGYRVVAVEAIPDLCTQAARRFHAAIEQQRLTIVNAAISDRAGETQFWISDVNPEWSSLDQSNQGLSTNARHAITVPTQTFDSILARYGAPYYLKIDIEGSDHFCLEALAGTLRADRPRYVSTELREDYDSIGQLEQLGYTDFKVISQYHFVALSLRRTWYERFYPGLRHLRKLSGYITRKTKRRVVSNLVFNSQHDSGWTFSLSSSGPFGEKTAGRWQTGAEARKIYRHYSELHRAGQSSPYWQNSNNLLWLDLHARRSS